MENSYLDKVSKDYEPYKEALLENLPRINKLQERFGFKEFYDVTTRCTNAVVRTMRYMKKHDMKYDNPSIENHDYALMVAAESYIMNLYNKAQIELNKYVEETNKISNEIINSREYKEFLFKKKIAPKIKKFKKLDVRFDAKPYYLDSQKYVDSFMKIGEKITEYNIEKDLMPTVEFYLRNLYKNLKSQKLNENRYQNIIDRNNLFHIRVDQLMLCFKKINAPKEAFSKIRYIETLIMVENLKDEIKVEYPEIEDLGDNKVKIK